MSNRKFSNLYYSYPWRISIQLLRLLKFSINMLLLSDHVLLFSPLIDE